MEKLQIVQTEQKKSNVANRLGVGFGVLTASTFALANPTAPDLTPIITMITGLAAVVASIGMAVLTVYATAKVFKWVKTAF